MQIHPDQVPSASIPAIGRVSSPYLTRRQTAEYLSVSEKWLAQSGRTSGPPFYKFGNQCRYLVADVVSWARQQRAPQSPAIGLVR
ncbi:hypothetical protein ABIB49_000469 [Arthrobacter sp. UYCu512]